MDLEKLQEFLRKAPKEAIMSDETARDFYTLGFSLYQAGSFEEASRVFQVLSIQKPLEYKHWFGLASSLQERKEYEKALPAWAMAAVLDQSLPYPHFHAAECAFSLDRKEEAKAALESAFSRASEYPILQDQIAVLKQRWSEMA